MACIYYFLNKLIVKDEKNNVQMTEMAEMQIENQVDALMKEQSRDQEKKLFS